ncbi:DUF1543 domain-containing protein [Sphingobacterium griseoflavum]|uniref:DUF1543 domain-containing protein n=1 Tax=Sphingobacterium griseoflavum TaxID=1474952 RepID=A0ABQ3HUV4_9SPHI|nr:DUF1543 domain-containing protein [Sphingobacterium griseoflavum]GHE30723.1 hypothetical protein GCM10017764_12090 [Sphingobacterium griseoflavum]
MVLLGCKPSGRFTEQHDIFFGIAGSLGELKTTMVDFWPEAEGQLHVDAWRKVSSVEGYRIAVVPREQAVSSKWKLFFVNLGGYRGQDFEEYHYKQLVVAEDVASATKAAKSSSFFKDYISPHIDDKYGLDVDDVFSVEDALPLSMREHFKLYIESNVSGAAPDKIEVGYIKFSKLQA